ncbi:hypothetical protein RCG24_04250 [Neobacillus sp. OS1-32]|jgi:hypothetical protein|uniref:Uncharacterized protein n=1 Tax=Neobacillus paridis TaxID=2803862 RepID=A0ABS1TM29_9BACI|nr:MULTISPECIES: hypothetical protein [Neobacillus]MBL4951809.1 hypothetical protein [Neobacillus paridis]WML31103.1 hypothetical protein RCG24_04250 [Neobacillus sp. OS1-32]
MDEEKEFSPEEIQTAANEVRRGGFGDFMFMDPNRNQMTTQRRTSSRPQQTSRKRTSRMQTSRNRTSRKKTSRRTSRHLDLCCTEWRNTGRGRHQTMSCWKDSNMWVYRVRRR